MTPAARRRLAIDLRHACMRISRRNRFENTESVAPHQFSVLVQVEKGVDRPGALARAECVSPPSMTRTVNALVEGGLLARHDDPDDGRAAVLTLTDAGLEALAAVRRSRDAWMITRIAELSDEECRVLDRAREILARVADMSGDKRAAEVGGSEAVRRPERSAPERSRETSGDKRAAEIGGSGAVRRPERSAPEREREMSGDERERHG